MATDNARTMNDARAGDRQGDGRRRERATSIEDGEGQSELFGE